MFALALAVSLLGSMQLRDGTIVVLENSNAVVKMYTKSEITHVAMIMIIGGQPRVYEATPSAVRCVTLSEYFAEIAESNRGRDASDHIRLRLYQPTKPYSAVERSRMVAFYDSQLGRRYSTRGYVRQEPGDGIHCAELVSTALVRTGRFRFPPNYGVSPAALVAQIKPSHDAPLEIAPIARRTQDSWCQRSWNWWSGLFDWCGWACWETWTMCW
jgi:hypothetical protein